MQELQRHMKKKYESVCSCRGRKGNSSKLDVMKQVERQTLLEVQQGLCAPGMDKAACRAEFTDKDGVLWARPSPRHGVYQGKKLAGDGITLILGQLMMLAHPEQTRPHACTKVS